jgi:hypothetical protein
MAKYEMHLNSQIFFSSLAPFSPSRLFPGRLFSICKCEANSKTDKSVRISTSEALALGKEEKNGTAEETMRRPPHNITTTRNDDEGKSH